MDRYLLVELRRNYKRLKPFYESFRQANFRRDQLFQFCVKSSFAKAYEFNVLAISLRYRSNSFFLAPTLRGICEDIILLDYFGSLAARDRNELVRLLMVHEVFVNLRTQSAFFSSNRPFQPVLPPHAIDEAVYEKAVLDLQTFWKKEGWNLGGRKVMPPVRQLAAKKGTASLYDYLYRLTCDMVHFNPQVLLRAGWGSWPSAKFSAENFEPYYRAFAVIYGSYLFCIYFEPLRKALKPSMRELRAVQAIRDCVLEIGRWPEIVTYEEMNAEPPWKSSILHMIARSIDNLTVRRNKKRFIQRRRLRAKSSQR